MSCKWSEIPVKFHKKFCELICVNISTMRPPYYGQFTCIKKNRLFKISIRSEGNKAYPLKLTSTIIPVYCHVTDDLGPCGGGGWTLVMKINGSKVALGNSNGGFIIFGVLWISCMQIPKSKSRTSNARTLQDHGQSGRA